MTHTPTPWAVTEYREVVGPSGRTIHASGFGMIMAAGPAQDAAHANSAFIVRACNAHDDLLATLKAFPGFTDDATIGDLWIERMRAAIDKAEGR